MILYCLKYTDMKEPKRISEIIESMDIFAKEEPKPLIFKPLRTKKIRCGTNTTEKTKFLNALNGTKLT